MTVGGDDCEDENEVNDLRETLRAWSTVAGPSSSAIDHPMVTFFSVLTFFRFGSGTANVPAALK